MGRTLLTITESFSPGHPELQYDLVLPDGRAPAEGWPVIVWLHGGGWRLQDRHARPDFDRHFAARGFAMVSVDYRLAPQYPHPAQVVDLRLALRHLRAHAGELGIDPQRIGLWGSSAGGHVAAFTALSSGQDALPGETVAPEYRDQSTAVQCVVEGYGPALIGGLLPDRDDGGMPATPEEDLLGGPAAVTAAAAQAASPALLPVHDAPPFLILHGTGDRLVPAAQSRALHDHLVAGGGESLLYLIEGFGHGFLNPGTVQELGPGVRLDNGRLEAEPTAPAVVDDRGTFDPRGRAASFDLIADFFAAHLSLHGTDTETDTERTSE